MWYILYTGGCIHRLPIPGEAIRIEGIYRGEEVRGGGD